MSEINYSWSINKLECAPSEDGLTNVVKVIHWSYRADEQIEGGKSFEISNQYPLTPPLPENYVEYSLLTPEIVIGWLEGNLDVEYLRRYLSKQIEYLKREPITALPLPWIKEEVVIPPEEPVVDVVSEEPVVDVVPEEPVVDVVPEEPVVDVVPEEPVVDVVPEEPVVDVVPEEPVI